MPPVSSSPEHPLAPTLHQWRQQRAYLGHILDHLPTSDELTRQRLAVRRWQNPPKISIVTPVYATPPDILRRMVRSIQHQSYPHWELCMVDDGSPAPWNPEMLSRLAAGDARIRIERRPHSGGIAAASNDALAMATGEFVAFVDHDDELDPRALYEVARVIAGRPEVDAIYTDLDVIGASGRRGEPLLMPDWSPELLLGLPFVVHLTAFRRSLVESVGGFRSECDGAQDYDLILRISRHTDRFAHIAKVLYHWRAWSRSMVGSPDAKPYAYASGIRAIADHLAQGRFAGRREPGPRVGTHAVRFAIEGTPLVSVIVAARSADAVIARLAAFATAAPWTACEYIVAGTRDEIAAIRAVTTRPEPRFIEYDGPPDAGVAGNAGAAAATGEHLLFLDAALEPQCEDWLTALLELSQQPGIGAVSGCLLDRDGRLWHAGMIVTLGEPHLVQRDDRLMRNWSAVTGTCLMTPRATFDAVGGFTPAAQVGHSDVDYCLRVREHGERIAFTPHSLLRFTTDPPAAGTAEQRQAFQARWLAETQADPYYHPLYRQDDAWFEVS